MFTYSAAVHKLTEAAGCRLCMAGLNPYKGTTLITTKIQSLSFKIHTLYTRAVSIKKLKVIKATLMV